MSDELDFTLEVAKDSMIKAITHLENELTKIRAGKANPDPAESYLQRLQTASKARSRKAAPGAGRDESTRNAAVQGGIRRATD